MPTQERAVELEPWSPSSQTRVLLWGTSNNQRPNNSSCFLSVPCVRSVLPICRWDTEVQKGAGPWLGLSRGLGGQS